jgi:cholesterol transport system auxiliary component
VKNNALLVALPLALALGGCLKFGAEPPPSFLTLDAAVTVPVGETERTSAPTITVAVPVVPQELGVARIPVRSAGNALAYLKDAQWVEPPSRLFARLLADTLTASTGFVVLSGRQSLLDPGASLGGELRAFGVDAEANEAVVTYDAVLIRKGGESPVAEKRRFEARVPLAEIAPAAAGAALNQAANQVAGEVAAWVGG